MKRASGEGRGKTKAVTQKGKENACWTKRDDHPLRNKQCCCKCSHRLRDYSHPCTDGKRIFHVRGHVCAPPGWPGVHSGWPAHSIGCELFERKRRGSA